MRLVGTRPERLATVPYRAASPGGVPQNVQLGVERLLVDKLPAGCDALLAAGDLQGVAPSPLGGDPELLGIALADYLGVWAESGLLPPVDRAGVLLTGDLYSAPGADRRGGSGSVLDVWIAFAAAGCPMVFGVAGNHDEVTAAQVTELGPDVALLDGPPWLRRRHGRGGFGDRRRPRACPPAHGEEFPHARRQAGRAVTHAAADRRPAVSV